MNKITDNSGEFVKNLSRLDAEVTHITEEMDNVIDEAVRVSDVIEWKNGVSVVKEEGNEKVAEHISDLEEIARNTQKTEISKTEHQYAGVPDSARYIVSQWSPMGAVTVRDIAADPKPVRETRDITNQNAQNELNVLLESLRDAKYMTVPSFYE